MKPMHVELSKLTVRYAGLDRPAVDEVSFGLPAGGIGVLDVFENGVRVAAWNVDALRADAP